MFGAGAPKCPRCTKSVYEAEEVRAAGQRFHVQCFTCSDCHTRLNSTTLCDANSDIFCSACYAKRFGPKGFGIGGLSVHTGQSVADAGACGACGAKDQTGKFCGACGKATGAAATARQSPAPPASSPAPPASTLVRPSAVAKASGGGGGGVAALGGGDQCAKCHKTVYAAERVQAAGRLFHDSCLTCSACSHAVSSVNINDKDGRIFCQPCYAKQYGPKGYGFAGGAAGLMTQ